MNFARDFFGVRVVMSFLRRKSQQCRRVRSHEAKLSWRGINLSYGDADGGLERAVQVNWRGSDRTEEGPIDYVDWEGRQWLIGHVR